MVEGGKRLLATALTLCVIFSSCVRSSNDSDDKVGVESITRSVFEIECAGDEVTFGSGVAVGTEGNFAYLVTSFHVVYGYAADEIRVFAKGSFGDYYATAATVCVFADYDVAVLRVDGLFDLFPAAAVAEISDKGISTGERVYAVGNALGKGISVTSGVVSVESEIVTIPLSYCGSVTVRQLRTDAPLNTGCSGGGLFNESGELVGMLGARNGNSEIKGVGYATPARVVKILSDKAIKTKNGEKPATLDFGATFVDTDAKYSVADNGSARVEYTVKVDGLRMGTVANAFLREGDVIDAVYRNGEKRGIENTAEIEWFLLETCVEDVIRFEFTRNGTSMTYEFTVTENLTVS